MRKPLNVAISKRAVGGAASRASLWAARMEQRPERVGREGERKARR